MSLQSAHSFLEEAGKTLRDRAALRDAPKGERSMARTVAIFNAWTASNLSEQDGWRFMIALKQAREIQGKFNRDDYVDLAAYSGLLGENQSLSRSAPAAEDNFQKHLWPKVAPLPMLLRAEDVVVPDSPTLSEGPLFEQDKCVGVPFGAVSLGAALNEE